RVLFVLMFGLFLCNPLTTSAESDFSNDENEVLSDNTRQQQIEVNGTVTDARTGDPLPGVNIVVEGTTTGTTTDMEGDYTLEAPADATLIFSFVGYQEQSVEINGRQEINIEMEQAVTELEEVVAVGYGTQTREQVTGAVSTVSSEDLADVPEISTGQALQGKLSGVTVRKSPVPGGGSDIRIRGMTTINNNDPLWVVDGVPGGEAQPEEIESISVLKGASATAIYGARGAGGVILVTTKSGEKNTETQINFTANHGMNRAKEFYDMLNTREYAELVWLEQRNAGVEDISHVLYGSGDEPDIPEYVVPPRADPNMIDDDYIENNYDRRQSDEDGDGTHLISKASVPGTDWFDVVTRNGLYQKYNLSIQGGSETTNFGAMAGYLKEEAYVKYSDFERFNLRLNADHDLTDWLTVGERLKATYSEDVGSKDARGGEGSIIAWCYRAQPIIPVYDVKGNFMGSKVPETGNAHNPLATLYRDRNNFDRDLTANGNFNVQANIIEGLSFKSLLGFEYNMSNSKWYGYRDRENTEASKNESVGRYSNESRNWNWSNTLNYTTEIGGVHRLDLMAGTEAVENLYYYLSGNRQAYFSPELEPATSYMVLNSGAESESNSGSYSSWSTFSMFTRLNYQYGDRYILNATFRRDGSSRFGSENRYGNFPAFSLGWRVTEESFMDGTAPWLDFLKIRGGWGLVGNDRIGNYNGFTTYSMSSYSAVYPWTGSNVGGYPGIQAEAFGNPEARWETTETINLGLQATVFEVLDINIDVWEKNTSDMLYPATIPAVEGSADIPSINVAEMNNRGMDVELNLTSPESQGDFTYDISLNVSHYKNEIEKLTGTAGEKIWSSSLRHMRYARAEEGTEFPEFYGYVVEGIFQSEEEAANHPNAFGETGTYNEAGRFKYKDVNGDGIIDEDDRTYIGSPHPDFTAGLNITLRYGNFDLRSGLYSSYGNDIVNYARRFLDFHMFQGGRSHRTLYESWGSPYLDNNENAKMPKYEPEDSKSQRPSTYFVEDGSYLRMNNLEIGYNLPDNLTNRLDMNRVRIYARATNLFTITGYSGLDPEVYTQGMNLGQDRGSWPVPQQFMFGINVNM
ncbi:MAG: TonB-dependent receptor, partial [Bacteroidales bacterium]|nr:TonB-dependent receptor [Bacteroidales bacterium]